MQIIAAVVVFAPTKNPRTKGATREKTDLRFHRNARRCGLLYHYHRAVQRAAKPRERLGGQVESASDAASSAASDASKASREASAASKSAQRALDAANEANERAKRISETCCSRK